MAQNDSKKFKKGTALSFALSQGGGFMLIQATVASFISVFMTDTVLIPATAGSIIMLVATLWDAINDPLMGGICDRTRTRHGSYRPYLLWVPGILTIVSFLLFLNPDLPSTGAKIAWFSVFYILYGMSVTALQMPQFALIPAVTKDDDERSKAIQLGQISVAIAYTIASTFTAKIVESIGSYAPVMLVYGIMAILANLWLFRTTKENYRTAPEKGRSILNDLNIFFKHYKLFIIMIVWVMASLGYGSMFSTSVYYIMYYIMRPDLIGLYMGILSIGALLSMMVLMPILLRTLKSVTKTFIITQAATLVCYVILFFFANRSLTILFVGSFLATMFSSMEQGLINFYVNDTIDYIMLMDGQSLNGMVSAIKGFAYKCGSTLVSSGILAILAAAGYIAGAIGGQPESVMLAINCLRFAIPAATCLIIIICLIFNPIEPHRAEINEMKAKMHSIDES